MLVEIKSPKAQLQTLRWRKSPAEAENMRQSTKRTAQAFKQIMKATRPGTCHIFVCFSILNGAIYNSLDDMDIRYDGK